MSGVGSSPALAKCETSQVLLSGVPGDFSRGSPILAQLLIGQSHMSEIYLERDVKLNKKKLVLYETMGSSTYIFAALKKM